MSSVEDMQKERLATNYVGEIVINDEPEKNVVSKLMGWIVCMLIVAVVIFYLSDWYSCGCSVESFVNRQERTDRTSSWNPVYIDQ